MFLLLILFLSLIFPNLSFAQTPTVDPKKTEAIREMTEKKVQDMLQQSDSENSSISTSIPKSIIGTITQIENSQININSKNENKKITITDETVFIDAKKNKIKFSNLNSGQIVLSMGYYDQYNNFEAKRIIITSSSAIENKNEIIFGTIADISQTSNVLVLIPIKNKNTQYQIKTDSQTKVVDKDGSNLTIDKLKSGQKVVVVIQPDTKIANTFNVSQIITFNSVSPTPTLKK